MVKKISELTELAAQPADSDELEINDGGTSKKIQVSNLLLGAGGGFSTVYKTADETINSDTTLTDDTDLQFSLEANKSYIVMGCLLMESETNSDWKQAFSAPAGCSAIGSHKTNVFPSAAPSSTYPATDVTVSSGGAQTNGLGTWNFCVVWINIVNGANAGTFAYQWAQNVSQATDTNLKKGSWLAYQKLD